MTITAFNAIRRDKDEYSLYYRQTLSGQDLSIINATVDATGVNGDLVYLSLVASLTGRVIKTKSGILTNGSCVFRFNLAIDSLDTDGIYRARQGSYTLIASSLPGVMGLTSVSTEFSITPASAVEFRETWLVGIPLIDERTFLPVVQGVTGVTGVGARDVQRGGYTLQWTAASRTLSWENGPTNVVPASGYPYTAVLWPDTLDQTITFSIDPTKMPATDVNGYVMVDYASLGDSFLRNHLAIAIADIESDVNIPLEPALSVSSGLAAQFPLADNVGSPAPSFTPNYSATRPMRIQLPMRRVIKVHAFGGYQGATQVLTVPDGAVQLDSKNGIVNLVPTFSGQYPAPTAVGFGGLLAFGGSYNTFSSSVPNYWQYAVTYGLDNLGNGTEAIAREAVFRRAAITVLSLVGRARTDILAGESFSRDGGSLSRQFTGGQYGVYTDLIMQHKEWMEEEGGRHLMEQLAGMEVTVAGS